jgi:N-acetylglucosaminyldiphosphoundecaprenol N-acetyl-beta-D-mannosaminyltransferase
MRTLDLLGTPLLVTDYAGLAASCRELTASERPTALNFSNTQIVTMRRHEPPYRKLSDCFDFFVPDGMPLIWALNRRGAGLRDRVYGPTFMRKLLEQPVASESHYLIGGSEECRRRLAERFPNARIVGGFHGRCDGQGVLEGSADQAVPGEINRLAPDFVWIGLGTPKQDAWIARNKCSIKRGVILAVGFAFDVNAGMKPDAPAWMQRAGLTWVFRLVSEPRRLLGRYLRYNTLFLFYLVKDALGKRT